MSQLRPRVNVERLFFFDVNPLVLCVTVCVLSYGYGSTSVISRQPWSSDVFLYRKDAAY